MKHKIGEFLSENTPISVGVVSILIGGVVWLTQLYAQTNENSEALKRIEMSQDQYNKNMEEIRDRLARIEGKLSQ